MYNGNEKGQRRPDIFEIATAYENGNGGIIKPRTNVVVNTNRLWYGKGSTVSAFLATAYDEQGKKVDSMKGYFLEPEVNYDSAKVAGGDKAIMYGTYNVIPKKELEERINRIRRKNGEKDVKLTYEWYVDNVPGRSGIAIHSGANGEHTLGCLLPGDTLEYNDKLGYTIKNSPTTREKLFKFFNNYGKKGIKINIGF
jgi:hypothetical protein